MKKIDIQKHKHLVFGSVCAAALVALYIVGPSDFRMNGGSSIVSAAVPVVTAPPIDPYIRGWAWSSTIGWINFDCRDVGACGSNYKTAIDITTGNVAAGGEHWAWSSTIGWIDTNPSGGYPAAPNHGLRFNMSTGEVTGWIRALAFGDGWDGWIKIMDAKVSPGGYVTNNTGTDGGWMWGSMNVGWVKTWMGGATGMRLPVADCAFAIDPALITPPQNVTLAWACNQLTTANSCSINNGVGTNMAISGNRNARPVAATTYTLTCQGLGGPVIKTVNATVSGNIRIIEVSP